MSRRTLAGTPVMRSHSHVLGGLPGRLAARPVGQCFSLANDQKLLGGRGGATMSGGMS